jgi:sulfide:quinone oxidoreductase
LAADPKRWISVTAPPWLRYVDFGGDRIGRMELDFYSRPKLGGIYYEPSAAWRADKQQFGATRRTPRFRL